VQPICTHKISLHSAKASHAYPIIRLPREFCRLAGGVATIYETTHNGALAFLVVPCRKGSGHTSADIEKSSLDMAEVAGPNPAELVVLFVGSIGKNEDRFEAESLTKYG
jgi:hypothetical protein